MSEVLVQGGDGYAVLQDDLETSTVTVSGVAIGTGDITRGQSGILKRWPASTLKEAAETLEGKSIVIDHRNREVEKVKGQVTKAGYKQGVGVIFEGEMEDDDELVEKVGNGWLDVSPRILHEPLEEMEKEGEEDNDDPVHVVGEIKEFVNLSLVVRGAAESNSITVGEHENLSNEAVMRFVKQAVSDSLAGGTIDESAVDVSVDVSVPSESLSDGYSDLLSNLEFSEGDTSSEDEESTEGATESAENDSETTDELAEHTVHEPDFSDTREAPWNEPSLEDFTDESWDDLSDEQKSEIGEHFLGSKSGFPAENFGDHFLPVVDSENNLVLNALQNAKARVGQVSGLSDEDEERAENLIDRLANENFEDANFGDDEENEMDEDVEFEVEEAGLHTFRMSLFDRPVPEDEANSVENSLSQIDGVEAITKAGDDNPQVIVVIDPDEISDGLNENIRNALDETPFAVRDDFDWVDRVVRNEGDRLSESEASDYEVTGVDFLGDDDSQNETSTEDVLELEILQ